MKSDFKNIHYFLIPYLIFIVVLTLALVSIQKAELHLLMNSWHNPIGDLFFKFFTEVGGDIGLVVILLVLLFYRYSIAIYLAITQIIGGIISITTKLIFNEPRPFAYFQRYYPDINLPQVSGVDFLYNHSFPSGHTITAFAIFFGLSLITQNKWYKLIFFFIAAMAGYSRVYLSQHFAVDIIVGSAIGIIVAWGTYPIWERLNKKLGNKSLKDLLMKKKFAEK